MPRRIQLRRTKGWRKPEGAVVVARPSKWGNPFKVITIYDYRTKEGRKAAWGVLEAFSLGATEHVVLGFSKTHKRIDDARERAVWLYRQAIVDGRLKLPDLAPLCGHDLACWCPLDQPCHADVLLELANKPDASGMGS